MTVERKLLLLTILSTVTVFVLFSFLPTSAYKHIPRH